MRIRKVLSMLFVIVMIVSCFSLQINAAKTTTDTTTTTTTSSSTIDYSVEKYTSADEKLKTMTEKTTSNGYKIYVQEETGEVAYQNVTTGQVLFSNPYDIATNTSSSGGTWPSSDTRQKLLSQIIVAYQDNGTDKTMYSYTDAALRDQIIVKNIKNGIRVEYTIGELETTRLVPRRIEKSRFETLILANIDNEWHKEKLLSFYQLYDTTDPELSERVVKEIEATFPITKSIAIYVCDTSISSKELKTCENIIKTYCPNYTYEEMDYDHTETEYVGTETAPPNFKMALEYTVDEDGLSVRLPANGIRFDESTYQLTSVTVLPYMGAGNNKYTGYNFIPDGSGTLVRFEDVKDISYTVSGQMYGTDYAYHTITGQHNEVMRMPVFGVVTNIEDTGGTGDTTTAVSTQTTTTESSSSGTQDLGFVAIITEGDSMAKLMSESGGSLHPYNSVYAVFNPRPSDTYTLDSSTGSTSQWTVVSSRKYTGSYVIKYIMLTDDQKAAENGIDDYYKCSYVGMATAYRDYLEKEGILTRLTDTDDSIPLYIESFGSIETTETVLSFPVSVDTPLTTFDNLKTMYDELSESGITNISFKLTGFANGGMMSTYPTKVSWVDAVGGSSGFNDLVSYANEKGFSIYPDFDFAYLQSQTFLDGVSTRNDAVQTIDGRYTTRRYYNSATQSFESDSAIAISASSFSRLFAKFSNSYSKYNNDAVSVSTLGTDLNTDFDEDDPYNREDSKEFTVEMLQELKDTYSKVMVDGGNAYTYPYVTDIVGVSTDSSGFLNAAESVPFAGMVLHGYVDFTGEAINMEGDVSRALLKTIENGASLYYVLSYENTVDLKESEDFNDYYSVSYSTWKDTIESQYQEINDAMSDLQDKLITDHEFIEAERVLSDDEQAEQDEAQQTVDEENVEYNQNQEEINERQSALKERIASEYPELDSSKGIRSSKEVLDDLGLTKSSVEILDSTVTSGTVVRIEYEGGVQFILNYNSFGVSVTVDGQSYEVGALSFVRIG